MIQLGLKRRRISVLYVAIATLLVGVGYSTYAQLSTQAYTVETVHIFPSQIKAEGFENAETLTFQNLEEFALLQDFNAINSATLDRSFEGLVEQVKVTDEINRQVDDLLLAPSILSNEEDFLIISVPSTTPIETDVNEGDDVEVITEIASSSVEVAVEPEEELSSADDEVPATEDSANNTEEDEETGETTEDTSSAEIEVDLGTTTVLRGVDRFFALAIETLTETFSSTSATSTLETEEVAVDAELETSLDAEEATEVIAEQEVSFGFATATDDGDDVASTENTDEDIVFGFEDAEPLSENTETAADGEDESGDLERISTTTEEMQVDSFEEATDQAASSTTTTATCEPNCNGHVLKLGNFGYPLDEGVQLSGAQLRMSFAAKRKESQSDIPSFVMNYSLDGGVSWSTGGSVVIEDEVSNSINGGYYLFALPAITNQESLQNLQVELRYDDDSDLVEELYVESAWLELFILQPPTEEIETPISELLADDGYQETRLSGDVLELSGDEQIEFTFTDDNTNETLIIKSDQKKYNGLSEVTTYFSVTNASTQADEFTVQTYFPQGVGEVTDLQVYNLNKPRQAIVPEYRPYVYHCEAGWSQAGVFDSATTLTDVSIAAASTTDIDTQATVITSGSTSATSSQLSIVATSSESLASTTATLTSDEEGEYVCRDTSVVRVCDSLEGEGTACIVSEKVQDHNVTKYAPGWDEVVYEAGEAGRGGLLSRIGSVFGFGPERKEVPDSFEGEVYSDETITIAPGETRYFKMDIAFPPFSNGEYWIEAIGDSEYGLLDPFWSSDWTYRMPFDIANPIGSDQTEFQVKLELDSSIADFWANVDPDGDDIRFVQEVRMGNLVTEAGPQFENAYDPAWNGRVALTVDADNIDNLLTDYPLYVNLADLGPDFWGSVQTDGRDIRITESNGATELPYDLVSIDTAAQTGELHFLASRIDSGSDTTFHIYYDNPSAAAYAVSDTYGRNAVWANYEAVYHFEDDPTTIGNTVTDASGNGKELTVENAGLATTTGQLGTAVDLTGTTVGILRDSDWQLVAGDDHVSSGWYQQAANSAEAVWQWGTGAQPERAEYMPWYNNGTAAGRAYFRFGDLPNTTWDRTAYVNRWVHFTTVTGNNIGDPHLLYDDNILRINTVQDRTDPFNNDAGGLQVGRYTTGGSYNGYIDELRFELDDSRRSAAWVNAEYVNQSTSTDFYATSTQLVGGEPSIGWYDTSWNQRVGFEIGANVVAGTQTDFPVYLDLSTLGSGFFAGVAADGSDIRITTEDGKAEVPVEVVSVDTGAETGELYFKATISGGEQFYVYFDNEDATAYDRTDTYGSENVWTNGFRAVYHFEEEATGIANVNLYQDSTSNEYHADDYTTDTTTTGVFGQGVGFGAGVNDAVEPPNDVVDGLTDHTVSWWHNTTQLTDASILSGANATQGNEFLLFFPLTNQLNVYYNGPAEAFILDDTVGTFNTGLWQQYMVTGEDAIDEVNLYVNGQGDTENPDPQPIATFDIPNGGLVIGQEQDVVNGSYDADQRFIGQLDEMRIAEVVRSAEWAETEYENMANQADFISTSSLETLTVTEFVELDYWLQDWDSGSEEATVWVQVEDLPTAGATIYAYYGNNAAPAVSDEFAPFSYDTPTDIYYVVEGDNTTGIDIISYVNGNEVTVGGSPTQILDAGEIGTFTGYSQGDTVSVTGPITSKPNDNEGEPVVPIAFASDTFVTPSNRGNPEEWHIFAPFGAASVDVFTDDGGAVAVDSGVLAAGAVDILQSNVPAGDGGVVESDEPILLYTEATSNDTFNPYPVTTADLYGFDSNGWYISTAATTATYDVYCESGGSAVGTESVARGVQGGNNTCAGADDAGPNSAVRITNQDNPVAAIQEADSDGTESTSFWPETEFGTEYYMPVASDYIAVVCSPNLGTVTLEVFAPGASTPTETASCAPTATAPDSVRFSQGGNGDTLAYGAGTRVVSTNDVPFYVIMDHTTDDDETNVLGSLQGRKYGAQETTFFAGQQEEANGPTYEQLSFAWYENSPELTPTSTWAVGGGETVVEGDSITGAGAVDVGDVLRLRMNVVGGNATSSVGTETFVLQYAEAETGMCSATTNWYPLGGVGSSTAAFAGYNNNDLSDGTDLPSTLLASSSIPGSYEERNLTEFNSVVIAPGDVVEWDWAIVAENIDVNQSYCFRMIRAIGEEFIAYSTYPELETVGPPNVPTLITFFDNEKTTSLTPTLAFFSTDIAGDDIHYEIQIDDNADFSSVELTRDSDNHRLEFTNVNTPSDKPPFTSGASVRYDGTADLNASTTYYWRVRASDPDGSATSSEWSVPFSYTTDTVIPVSEWYQTTSDQFLSNEIETLVVSGGSVNSSAGNGRITGNPADFDDAVVGNAWGEAYWVDTETSGEILVQVQYNNNGNWQPIPNTEIPDNNLGTTTSPINLLQLDTNIYNELRLVANFTGATLSLDEWGIRWALRIETPVLGDLFDNQETADTLPVFDFVSSDPQGDDIEYEVSFSADQTFESSSSTFNSSVDPGFANAVTGADTSPFNSAETINYTTQAGAPFVDGETYWWRARAKDNLGGNVFSPWSVADSFTINAATTLSTWSQTTSEQFDQGFLDGTQATSSSVEISTDVGEFGTVDLTGNTWVQITTERTYQNMVVIPSSEFDFSFSAGDGRTTRVRNKTSNSFEIKVDNHLNSLSGPTTVDYLVVEAGEWIVDDGGTGVRLFAGTAEDVTEKQVSIYDNGVGQTITFPTNFGANPPAVFVNIATNNDSDWVDAHVDGGGARNAEVGSASMRIALAVGNHTASVHSGPEDIDYIAIAPGDGTVDGGGFQSLNTIDGPDGFGGSTFQQPLTGFTSAPAITLVQNNAEDGGQGGFAFKDLQGTNSNTSLALSVAEIGVNADGHTTEVVSVLAFENTDGIISRINDGTLSGTIAGEDIIFSDGAGPKFDNFSWVDTTPGSSYITYQMQYLVSEDTYALIPDAALPGNSSGFTGSPIDLTSVDINIYDQIRPFATLQCVTGDCPTIDSWKLEWSEGVNMSGTLQEYDRSTAVATGTISASINGGAPITGGTVTGGVWTLNNVTAFAGDVVTVWVDGAEEAEEAVSVFVYDGLGDITGVKLYEQHLAIDADELGTITNDLLGRYDNSDDEDIMFSVGGLNNLNMCASGTCAEANIYVGQGQTYIPATSSAVTVATHDFINDGTIELDSNVFTVSGSWTNNATSTTDTSTINMTAATGTESVSSTESPLDFHTLNFGGFGTATFTIAAPLDLSGDLTVATGTFARDGFDVSLEGSLTTDFGGVWDGTGTTTFDGNGGKTWSDSNVNPENIGNVIIDGPSTIVTMTSDVAAYDVYIGANDTLVGSADNTVFVGGDWTNTGTFNAGTGIVEIVNDDREYPGIVPGSADWYSDTSFTQRMPIIINESEVEGTLTNFPVYVDLASLGDAFWTNVASDGRDIRITTGNGQSERPHDLVSIDTAARTGELHLLADSVSSTADTTFYLYFDSATAVPYDSDATYGSEAVWADYVAVYHFEDDPTLIGNSITDETGNGKTLQVQAEGLSTTTGQLGVAYNFDSSTNGFLRDSDFSWESGDYLTTSGWYFMEAASNDAFWQFGTGAQPDQISYRPWYSGTNGLQYFGATAGATYSINPRDPTNWHHFTTLGATSTSDVNLVFEDAIQVESNAQTIANPQNTDVNGLQVGRVGASGASINAYFDEFRIASVTRNTDWIEAEYNNQFSPNIFYSTSTVDVYDEPVVLDAPSHVITGGGSAFNILRFNDATTSPSFADPSVAVNDDFIIATGTVALPTGILTIGGSFLNSGFFMHNNAEIEFTSNGTEVLQLEGTNFLNQFNDVTFDGSGTWTFTDVNATTTGYMNIEDGTVVFPTNVLAIGDTLDVLSGGAAFDNASGTVRFVSGEAENIRTAGSTFNDVVFGDGAFGWYDENWSDRITITIDAEIPDETLTNYPFYVNLANLPSEFWSVVSTDGRDIRVTTANGESEVPVDLVEFNGVDETGELHFLAPVISDISSTTFYIYVGNNDAEAPESEDTYGRNNVWTGYEAVYHFNEDPATGVTDVSGNGKNLTVAVGTPATTTGLLGIALDTTGVSTMMADSDWGWTAGEDLISSGLYFMDNNDTGALWQFGSVCGTDDCLAFMPWYNSVTQGYHRFGETSGNNYDFPRDNTVWHHFTTVGGAADGSRVEIFEDSVSRDAYFQTVDGANPSQTGLQIGRYTTGTYMDIDIDELRFATTTPSGAWINYEYQNLRSIGTLYSAVAEDFGAAITSFTLNEAVTIVEGDVTLEGARLVAPTDTLFIGGSALNSTGVYDPNNATTTFNSVDLGESFDFGDTSFYNLSFDGVGGGWTVSTTTVDNNLTLVTGASYVQATGTTMTVGGIFSNQFASAATDWTDSTLVLTGGDYTVTDRLDSGDDYATLQVSNDTDIVIWNSTISTSSILDNSSIYMPDFAGIDGQLNIYGDYERQSGDEHWSYATDFDGTDLSGGGERQANVYLEGGTTVALETGTTLNIVGVPSASSTIQATFGIYSLELDAATLNATHFSMTDAGPLGLELRSGTTIADMSNADFSVAAGRTGLTVDADTINAQPSSNYSTVNFATSTATTIYKSEWNEQILLTIHASSAEQSMVNFPVYADLSVLGPAFWAGVRSDGADIRVTTDAGREVPIDLVQINSVAQTGELHFLAPEIASAEDTTFYVHYNNPSAAAYSPGDQFGAHAVWADYEAVYHFNENPNDGISDMTANGRDLSIAVGTGATTTGLIGTAFDTTSSNVMLEDADWTWTAGDDLVSSGLYFMDNFDTGALWQFGNSCVADTCMAFLPWYDTLTRGYFRFGETSGNDYNFTRDNTNWHHFITVGRVSAGENNQFFEDNTLRDTYAQSATGINPTQTGLQIGRYTTGTYMDIDIDELRFTTTIPTESWRKAEHNNLKNPYGFYGTSTGPTGNFNVTTDGVPSAFWLFSGGMGNIYGEAFDNDDGDPGSIQWDDSDYTVNISGTVYEDDGVTPQSAPVCNGSTEVVTVVLDGGTTYRTACDPNDGSYEITGIVYSGEPKITAYIESSAATPQVNAGLGKSVSGSGTGAGTSYTVSRPEVEDGTVLVAIITKDDEPTMTAPVGWTSIAELGNTDGDDIYNGAWYRVVSDASTEPATYSFTGDAAEGYAYWVGALVNVDNATPLDVASTWTKYQDDFSPEASSVTSVTNGAVAIAAWSATFDDDLTLSDGTWATQVEDLPTPEGHSMSVQAKVLPVAGPTGSVDANSVENGRESQAAQFVFRPAASVSATGSIVAAAVTQTPIGGGSSPYREISLRGQRIGGETPAAASAFAVDAPVMRNDDVLVAVIAKDDEADITAPAGWIKGADLGALVGSQQYTGIWYKVVSDASSEPATYNFINNDATAEEVTYWIGSFDNVDPTIVFDTTPAWSNVQNSSSPSAPSITTATDGAFVLSVWNVMFDTTLDMPGGSWTTLVEDLNQAGRGALNIAGQTFASAGATGAVTITSASTDDVNVGQFALRPAPAAVAEGIDDLDLYRDRVIVRHEDIDPLMISDMNTMDSTDDADLPFTVATSAPNTLDIADGSGLFVWHGTTFIPDGNVTLNGDGDSVADGSLTLGDAATYMSTGTDPIVIGGSLYTGIGASFDGAQSLLTFTAATSGQQIGSAASSTLNLYDIAFTGGGNWAVQTPIVVDQDILVQAGTVSGVSDITVSNGDFYGNGLVDMTGGTTRIDTDNTLGGTTPWTFNNLTLGNGAVAGVTTPASTATTTVRNQLRINSGHFLDALGSTWDLAGTGNVFIESGGFLEGDSTVRYSGVNPTILRTAYNNLVIDTESGATTNAIAPTTGLQVLGDLTVGALGTSTLNLDINDPLLAVGGDVYIGTLGTIEASAVNDIDAFGSWDNEGIFIANGGTVDLQRATGTATIAAGDSPFANLTIRGNANYTMTESATATENMSLGTGLFTLQNGETLSVGGTFTNSMPDLSTNWTGTTLRLYGSTAYTINNKTVGDTYNVIDISSSTHPRFWNSEASTVTTETGSSLYSMDHADVEGDLYIFGDFVNTGYDDYWSYAEDWDGASLAVPRVANVQIEDGGTVLYLGGSLSATGSSSATTTIAAQGSGPYDLTIGGTTTVDMNFYSVRDIAAAGLVLTGSPDVVDLSLGDFLVTDAGGSAITLGGTVINANTAQNFTGNRFATSSAINAFNITATGTAVSSWRFVNVGGNLDGELLDNDPGGDPGYVVWEDSAAIIDITGTVYLNDRVTPSTLVNGGVCDGLTNNIRLSIQGLTFASTSCDVVTGAYTIPNIGFGPSDTLTVYIDGESVQAANVTRDPISLITNMDLYENHVIVRHESGAPMDVAAMAVYDSSDDADIPFTAVDAATDTLTLPADFTLVVWDNMTFAPAGDVIITGGGSGASYDGSFELFQDATFDGGANEVYSIGGDLISGTDATFDADLSTTTFTSTVGGRTIDTNDSGFNNVSFTGSGAWTIADIEGDFGGDVLITDGLLTLPAATTTITGSFTNTGGAFDANGGIVVFDSNDTGNDVTFGGSDAHEVYFSGPGSWVFGDTNATTTASFVVATGTVTLPSGTLTVTDDFIVEDTIAHNSGTVKVVGVTGGNVVTLGGNDLNSLTVAAPAGDYTLTDSSAALLDSLTITGGTFTSGSDTVAIGGSFDASGGVYNNASGTLLFNSADGGEFIDPGTNDLYNVVISGAGGWNLVDNATTTNNFSLLTAGTFTVTPGSTLYVGNVFTNDVGGAATTWTGTTLFLDGQSEYETGAKTTANEVYDTVVLGENTDISSWNSSAATVVVPETSSWYSQDHAGTDGQLNIYGDYHIATTTEYWNATTDFDGATITSRPVSVQMASGTNVTLEGAGVLNIVGVAGTATTSITNQGSGTFTWIATGGTLNANQYEVIDLDIDGLQLLGGTTVTSLSGGYFTQNLDNQNLITLASTALNVNAGLTIVDTGFAANGLSGGVNVSLDATTTNSWRFTGLLGDLSGESFDVDGIDDCSSVRWDDSACLLTEQGDYRWRNDDGGEGAIDATWFDTDWSKRQRIRVINEDATAYASTAVKFVVEYDADMQSDFDDLRITNADGVTLVNFWIEQVQAGVEATVWLQAPALPAETVSEFYMYYGNVTAASVSDGDQVFSLIEDFEANDLTPYAGDNSLFNIANTFAYGGSLGLDTAGNENERATDGIARDDITVSQGDRIRFMQYIDTGSGSNDEVCTLFATQNPMTDNENYAICVEQPGIDRISLVRDVADTEFSGTILASSSATLSSGWYEFNIDWQTDGDIFVTVSDDSGVQIASMDATDTTYTTGGIGFTYWFQHGGWDSYVAWPRTDSIPVVHLGDEQIDGGATWANLQNTPTGGFLIGETARLRIGIENSGLPIDNQNFRLEYAPKLGAPSCEAVDGGTFVSVPAAGAGGTPDVTMVTSPNVTNGDATTDHLVTAAGDFLAGQVIADPDNQTPNFDLAQDRYTELEYAVALTVDADNDAYCFRVTNGGTVLDSYANLPELTLAFDPILDPVSINDGLDISLNAGTTTTVIASTTVTDLNGAADLVSATTTFYKTSVGANCTPNGNDCYVATSSCTFSACTATSCSLQCVADFAYHTDPTDMDGGEEWFAFMEVRDASDATDFGSSPGVELYTLRAMDVVNAINYGTVDIAQDTGVFNPEVNLVNIGNESIDIQVAGTDMTDGVTSVIPAAQQLFATTTFNYSACIGCSALTVTPSNIEVDLEKPTTTTPGVSDSIYWGIEVPFGTASNPHSGLNTFTAIAD